MDDRVFKLMREMIEAGATAASVGHAIALIHLGRPVTEARAVLDIGDPPEADMYELLVAQAEAVAAAVVRQPVGA